MSWVGEANTIRLTGEPKIASEWVTWAIMGTETVANPNEDLEEF